MLSTARTATLWKCKPPSVEEIHWAAGAGLSKANIEQTLHKMLENGYDFLTHAHFFTLPPGQIVTLSSISVFTKRIFA